MLDVGKFWWDTTAKAAWVTLDWCGFKPLTAIG